MWRVCGGVDVELMALWCDVVARIGLFDDSADLIEYGFFEPVLICAAWAGGPRIFAVRWCAKGSEDVCLHRNSKRMSAKRGIFVRLSSVEHARGVLVRSRLICLLAVVLFAVPIAERALCCCAAAAVGKAGPAKAACCASPKQPPVALTDRSCPVCQCCYLSATDARDGLRVTGWSFECADAASVQAPIAPSLPDSAKASLVRGLAVASGNRRQSVLCVWRN